VDEAGLVAGFLNRPYDGQAGVLEDVGRTLLHRTPGDATVEPRVHGTPADLGPADEPLLVHDLTAVDAKGAPDEETPLRDLLAS
jgi:hypothetical protein